MNQTLPRAMFLLLTAFVANAPFASAANPDLVARQKWLNAAIKKVSPALVSVQDGMGAGSGVVVSADGIVLTASHVVETRGRNSPRLQVVFPDGSTYLADLLGMSRSADAAMLKIRDKPRNGAEFPYAKLGESDNLERGEWCFALGHPGGFQPERPAPVRLGRVLSVGHRTIVSDCAIVLGDSGGPLFDMEGRVIGIHSMITEVIVENRHVAIDVFRRDGDRMEAGESWGRLQARDDDLVESNFFGVTLRWRDFTPEAAHVISDSPADRAGIRPGDILLRIANQKFADPLGLNNLLSEVAEDQDISVQLQRAASEREIRLTTGSKPSREELRSRRGKQVVLGREHANELEQQLTSFRKPGSFEKRSREEMDRFASVADETQGSVVTFRRKLGRNIAFGAVMSADGYVLTKASELEDEIEPECILSNGKRLKVREVAIDRAFDLMLVKVDALNLKPVDWASREAAERGTIVLTTDSRGAPFLPGVISVETRELESSKRGFLGIVLGNDAVSSSGVVVTEVLPGGAAERGKLKPGDSVMSVNGTGVSRREALINEIRRLPPNSSVTLRYERDNVIRSITVELTPQFIVQDHEVLLPDRYGRDNLGKFVSAHHIGFPEVLEHDTDLFPDQCGGPLFNIEGKAVGLNIARAARITSYAIPAAAVERVYRQLRSQDAGK